jgi:23S rRNA pseudouridine1911/1915/1917 synthase
VDQEKNKSVELSVGPDENGLRLDVFCASKIESLSRNQIQKANDRQLIEVDGVVRPDHYALSAGESVRVVLPPPVEGPSPPVPQDIPLKIVYEDDDVLVINKDAGIVVHPAHGNWDGTVVNAVLGRGIQLSTLGATERPGVVHRLDRDTSGLMVLAKTDAAYRGLSEQIKARRFEKTYHAIIRGNLGVLQRTIDVSIARHKVHRQRMAVVHSGGRTAITHALVVDSFGYFDYIRVTPVTGRTHQIRVHLEHISHPILGDPVYGGNQKKGLPSDTRIRSGILAILKAMPRQALHASQLSFDHPLTGRWLSFRTALPEDMWLVLEMLHSEHWIKEARR